ncbi:hypothetical protein ACQ4LE_006275 [Meloidogyne hapla]
MFSHNEYKDPYEPPLTPKVRVQRPPWVPCYKEYNGRPEWWAELAYKDVQMRNGIMRGINHHLNENDDYWYDPKVPDGTSVVGPFGLDTKYHRNLIKKGDQPYPFFEHQKKIVENSSQYKNIIKNFDISPEHPGFMIAPTIDSKYKEDYRTLGTHMKLHYWFQSHLGPRFWDKPINEGCIEKGLALAKYSTIITLVAAYFDIGKKDMNVYVNFRRWFNTWIFKWFPVPTTLAMTFGVSACTAAKVRHIDDTWNWTIASVVTGALHATMRDYRIQRVLYTSGGLIALFSYYQSARVHHWGTQGMALNKMYSGLLSPYTGPLGWKSYQLTPIEVSRTHYMPEAYKYISQ